MRRHEKEGYTRMQIQGLRNVAYWVDQVARTPVDGKYPGCDRNGAHIRAAVSDRFAELNYIAYERRYFKHRWSWGNLHTRLEAKLSLVRAYQRVRMCDKPKLP